MIAKLFEQQEIEKRWVEYISELYDDEQRGARPDYDDSTGSSITKEEVIWARKKMKDGKAAGADDIITEGLKALDEISLNILTSLCNKIYSTGYLPADLMKSVFITLPKKPKLQNALNTGLSV